jgi:hypothetical protein
MLPIGRQEAEMLQGHQNHPVGSLRHAGTGDATKHIKIVDASTIRQTEAKPHTPNL